MNSMSLSNQQTGLGLDLSQLLLRGGFNQEELLKLFLIMKILEMQQQDRAFMLAMQQQMQRERELERERAWQRELMYTQAAERDREEKSRDSLFIRAALGVVLPAIGIPLFF